MTACASPIAEVRDDPQLARGVARVCSDDDRHARRRARLRADGAAPRRVHLVHRGAKFSARQTYIDAVAAQPAIETHWNTVVEAIEGDDMVRKVRINSGGTSSELATSGFFAYVGLAPNAEFVPADIARDKRGGLTTNDTLQTSLTGVFAAGVVRAGCGGNLIDAKNDGEKAGAAAAKFLGK